MTTDTISQYNATEVVNPPTLSDILTDVLETPHILNEVIAALKEHGVSIVTNGYLKGYLDCLVDSNKIHCTHANNRIKIYSLGPVKDYTFRCCPSCSCHMIIYDSDVGQVVTCSKCATNARVEVTLGSGVQLRKER